MFCQRSAGAKRARWPMFVVAMIQSSASRVAAWPARIMSPSIVLSPAVGSPSYALELGGKQLAVGKAVLIQGPEEVFARLALFLGITLFGPGAEDGEELGSPVFRGQVLP